MTGRMLAASGALALFVAGVFVVLVVAVAGEREAARLARGSAEATAAATSSRSSSSISRRACAAT